VLNTPYGYKRKRWTGSTLDEAFSLKGNGLSPETLEGGLLSNVTYFAGTLAFKNEQDRQALKNLKNVASEIKNYDYHSLPVEHLEEEIPGFILRTALIRFPFKKETEENDYLLVYSIMNEKFKKEFLITAFPIKKEAYKKIISPQMLGINKPIVIRYNGHLEEFTERSLLGTRSFQKEKE
jgi:hypothetical protein